MHSMNLSELSEDENAPARFDRATLDNLQSKRSAERGNRYKKRQQSRSPPKPT
jgi:hypothetical protein